MMAKRVFQDWRIGVLAAIFLLASSFVWQGTLAIAGLALGLFATTFSLVFLWLAVLQTGKLATENAKTYRGGVVVGLGFLIKLPLFVGLGMVAQGLGGVAPTWFLIGLGVVYFALVGWAQTRA